MDDNPTTGQLIKAARKKAGMTQAELASKLGVPYQSVSQWERDTRNPKYGTIKRIAAALGIDPYSIMDFDTASEALAEDMMHPPTPDEHVLLRKYRDLDEYGKKVVDCVLEIEFQRYQKELDDEIFKASQSD
ncbi:MAG: helix-turn-helix domain-containing protein [Oscillibacter sp.]|nr:helix-turn-helix domain-containing protein [Oscillibacter sp.]